MHLNIKYLVQFLAAMVALYAESASVKLPMLLKTRMTLQYDKEQKLHQIFYI